MSVCVEIEFDFFIWQIESSIVMTFETFHIYDFIVFFLFVIYTC